MCQRQKTGSRIADRGPRDGHDPDPLAAVVLLRQDRREHVPRVVRAGVRRRRHLRPQPGLRPLDVVSDVRPLDAHGAARAEVLVGVDDVLHGLLPGCVRGARNVACDCGKYPLCPKLLLLIDLKRRLAVPSCLVVRAGRTGSELTRGEHARQRRSPRSRYFSAGGTQ
jgi:hypothetical protein